MMKQMNFIVVIMMIVIFIIINAARIPAAGFRTLFSFH